MLLVVLKATNVDVSVQVAMDAVAVPLVMLKRALVNLPVRVPAGSKWPLDLLCGRGAGQSLTVTEGLGRAPLRYTRQPQAYPRLSPASYATSESIPSNPRVEGFAGLSLVWYTNLPRPCLSPFTHWPSYTLQATMVVNQCL